MEMVDIFNQDAFGVVSLTDSINKIPHKPGQVGSLGIFEERGIATTSVVIEEQDGVLFLVPNTPRGAAAKQNETNKRKARSLIIPHLPVEDKILADEIQGVRAFGTTNELQTVQGVVNDRALTMSNSLDVTTEHLMLGAIKGTILDSDGTTVIYNLFTEFGVSQASEVDFDLDNASPAAGALRKLCAGILRTMSTNLGNATIRGAHAFCGSTFFDQLVSHPEVRETYLNQAQAAELRGGYYGERVTFGGITFEEYRGSIGGTDFITATKVHIFPVGVPGLFKLYFGPADYMETVNTIGLPKYMKQSFDPRFNKYVDLEAQSNPLPICTRPKVLIKGKNT